MNDQQFGAFIRDRRVELGWQAKTIAVHVGISPTHLSDIEYGRRHPSERVLWNLARVLGLDPFALHALAGRIPSGCVPQTYEKALAAAEAWRHAARCGPRTPDRCKERSSA